MNEKSNLKELESKDRKLKKLCKKIKKQMEFYFSDSNLTKDKFLIDLISNDPDGFVDLDVFKKFNKIKALTNSSEVIATALTRSDAFEISKDQKKIRRIAPLTLTKDFDACTLYVEKLPQNADHKWVKDVFGHFGSIRHVNAPRYKTTNKIKGFAFIEFETPEGVKNACEFYKISSEKEDLASEEADKNKKHAKKHKHEETVNDKKSKKSRTRSVSESSDKVTNLSTLKSGQHQELFDKDLSHNQNHPHKIKRKRKREDSKSEVCVKKPKESIDEHLNASPNSSNVESKIETQPIQLEEQITTDEEKTEVPKNCTNGTNTVETKRKRKRRKNAKKHSTSEKTILRVMPKSEWKMYRNKYLELQRTTMSLLKKQVMLETRELKEQECNTKPADVPENKKSHQFVPGVIIKVNLIQPVKNQSEIKTQVKANSVVAYIDAPVESTEIFIRCHNSEDAQAIIKDEKLINLGKAELVEGDDEQKYWEKLESDRKNKYDNPVIHKKRGREKLLAKAAKLNQMKNKHIFFDE